MAAFLEYSGDKSISLNEHLDGFLTNLDTAGNTPDVILLHIGTNDISAGFLHPEEYDSGTDLANEVIDLLNYYL